MCLVYGEAINHFFLQYPVVLGTWDVLFLLTMLGSSLGVWRIWKVRCFDRWLHLSSFVEGAAEAVNFC